MRTETLCDTYPDVIALLDKHKRQTSLLFSQADPNLAIHHQAMMQIRDFLLDTVRSTVDALVFLSSSPTKSVKAKKIAIACLNNVFLGVVAVKFAKLDKIRGLCNG